MKGNRQNKFIRKYQIMKRKIKKNGPGKKVSGGCGAT